MNKKISKTYKILLVVINLVAILSLMVAYNPAKVSAGISYAGGDYTNLCGGNPWLYNANGGCPGFCAPYSGYCSGAWVVKFTCNGWTTECGGSGTVPFAESSGGFQSLNTGISNQTEQIDVFDHNCRAGGGWTCGNGSLKGYMVWYHPQVIPPCTNSCTTSNPSSPNLISPGNGAYVQSTIVTLSWGLASAGQCGGNSCTTGCISGSPVSFWYQVNGPGGPRYGSTYSASVTLSGLASGNYTWNVWATSTCGRQSVSTTYSFYINNPPSTSGFVVSNQVCTP